MEDQPSFYINPCVLSLFCMLKVHCSYRDQYKSLYLIYVLFLFKDIFITISLSTKVLGVEVLDTFEFTFINGKCDIQRNPALIVGRNKAYYLRCNNLNVMHMERNVCES